MYFRLPHFLDFLQARNFAQQRRGNHAGERGHIFSVTFSRRRDIVHHPPVSPACSIACAVNIA